jgi:phosphoglycolate phosphatase
MSSPEHPVPDIDLVVFDWDGTLVDSTAGIVASLQGAAADLGLPVPSRERARHVIGLGLSDAIRHAVPEIAPAQIPRFVERYRAHFLALPDTGSPFEGIPELLETLDRAGVPMAVATGKSRAGLDRSLAQLGWASLFVDTRCADQGIPKPDPWMLRDLCQTLQVDPRRAVMIGDTTHDLQMAAALGTPAIAVTYGAHPPEALAAMTPAAIVEQPRALAHWLWPRLSMARRGLAAGLHWRAVCETSAIIDGGPGVRFEWSPWKASGSRARDDRPAFVVRHDGVARAYLNQCAHVPVELDWPVGQFFDDSGLYLVCATHGAMYRPDDGVCVAGPCRGRGLIPLHTLERFGMVWVAFESNT